MRGHNLANGSRGVECVFQYAPGRAWLAIMTRSMPIDHGA